MDALNDAEAAMRQLAVSVKTPVDKYQLLPAFLKVRGLVKQHIDSFNYFVLRDMKKIMLANDRIECRYDRELYLKYTNIYVGSPSIDVDFGVRQKLTPHQCRLTDSTYAAPIMVDIEYARENPNNRAGEGPAKITERKKNVVIGRLPIMLRSLPCILRGRDEDELAKLGECPLDPGGYFVVKGTERVILIQEQLSKNRIIIDKDNQGRVCASVTTSSTQGLKSKTVLFMYREIIYLKLNQFTKPVPIVAILKALGMESDQEIMQMVGRDPQYGALILPSLQECASGGVFSRQDALDYLVTKVTFWPTPNFTKEDKLSQILTDIYLANVPIRHGNFRPKCLYTGVMIRRMLDAMATNTFDDKDYVGNKRLELSGQLVALLFEDLFKSMNTFATDQVNRAYTKTSRSSELSFFFYIKGSNVITAGLERAISTGNWNISRFNMKKAGVSQVLCRMSFIAALGHMTRITPQFEKTRKVSGPRALQPSQWGMLCPCDTPEGEACGLTKNLALTAHVTVDDDEEPLITLCCSLGVEDLAALSAEELHSPNGYLVIFNGLILGKLRHPQRFALSLRKLRRAGKIGEFVSVFVNEKQRCVYVASDGGRVCRPLVIVEKGKSRITEDHMRELKDGFRTFHDFLRDGLIEYLDVNEENNAMIALYDWEIEQNTTHVEIEPLTLLGVVAGLIPYPHHNQSPRNTYQCAMGKQAMGNIGYNQLCRMDTLLYLLVYPQRPLLTTKTIELVGYDKLGAGQNATVAVMSYSGYDIEDAIVMNKASLDRGFGRCITTRKYSVVQEVYGTHGVCDKIVRPEMEKGGNVVKTDMRILDKDGIAAPGEIIRNGNVYVNKWSPKWGITDKIKPQDLTDDDYRPTRAVYKCPEDETVVVDRVSLFSDANNKLCFKLLMRHTRRPEVGDKFSSRHGQKGVVGIIVPQEDLPFSERGICPDLIMNPHGFPSRMTIGKMIELLGGKAGVSCGRFHYGSAFGEPGGHADRVEAISETLVANGYSYSGKDFLYSGITGYPLQAYIFMGPIYYQKLKHMVIDKMHARPRGPKVTLTRQPTEGRSRNGGLKLGEMERDCLVAYGASMLLYERWMLSSDAYQVHVCRKCGLLGYYNYKLKTSVCTMCKSGENVSTVKMPYACKLLLQELQSMNIVPRLKLSDD